MRTVTQIIPDSSTSTTLGSSSSQLIPPGPDIGMGNAPVVVPPGVKFNPANATPSVPSTPVRTITTIIPDTQVNVSGAAQNPGFLSKLTNLLNGSAQNSESLLSGILNTSQAIYNTPKAIVNWLDPKAASYIPSNNTNLGNLVGEATGIPISNSPSNNLLMRAGMALQPAKGLAELGGATIGGVSNWLNKSPSLQKITDLPPTGGAPPSAVTTPISPEYIKSITQVGSAGKELNKTASQLQKTIPAIYQQDMNDVTGGIGNIGDYLTINRKLANDQSAQMMNAYKQYGTEIPNHLQSQIIPESLSPGTPIKGLGFPSLQDIISNWNNLTPLKQQQNLDLGTVVKTPASSTSAAQQVQDWLGDDFNTAKSAAPTAFKQVIANPSIENNYNLARSIRESAAAASKNGTGIPLYQLADKILDEGVMQPLQNLDDFNGTNTAATVQAGRQLFKTNEIPYRSNTDLDNISSLDLTDPNRPLIEPSLALKSILKAKLNGDIPSDHILSSLIPDLQNLSAYKATTPLTNITEGRGNLNSDQLTKQLESAVTNNLVSPDHTFGQAQKVMQSAHALKYPIDQNADDQQALADAAADKNAMINKSNISNFNALNKERLQNYNTSVNNIAQNNKNTLEKFNNTKIQKLKRSIPVLGKTAVALSGLNFLNHIL